jgi:hypothetical protein
VRVFRFAAELGAWQTEAEVLPPPPNGRLFGERITMDRDLFAAPNVFGTHVFDRNAGGTSAWGAVAFLPVRPAALTLAENRLFLTRELPGELTQVEVYVRHLGGEDAWGLAGTLLNPAPAAGDDFGRCLAASGDVVAVSLGSEPTSSGPEAVHVYVDPSPPGPSGPYRALRPRPGR